MILEFLIWYNVLAFPLSILLIAIIYESKQRVIGNKDNVVPPMRLIFFRSEHDCLSVFMTLRLLSIEMYYTCNMNLRTSKMPKRLRHGRSVLWS